MSGGANSEDPGIGLSARADLDDLGRERPDPTPIAPPVGYQRQPSLRDQIRQMVRDERLAADLAAAGVETFEEADDFDVDDDFDPKSPYEYNFDPPADPPAPPAPSPAPAAPPAPPVEPAGAPATPPSPAQPASV